MSKVYANQVTVRVWRNMKTWGYVPTAHFGHAAVTLSGMFLKVMQDDDRARRRVHISFWPDGGASMSSAMRSQGADTNQFTVQDKVSEMNRMTMLRLEVGYRRANGMKVPRKWETMLADNGMQPIADARPGQTRRADLQVADGWPLWSQSPEFKVALPGFNNKGRLWGLSIGRMNAWWQVFSQSNPHYKALSHQNCAGVALMALRQGGSEAYVDLPAVRIYAEPLQVERYARMVEVQIDRLETWAKELDADIRQALGSGLVKPDMLTGLKDGLWDLQTWKQRSALGTFQMRSATIREIDTALQQYHANTWNSGFNDKYRALVATFMGVIKHRQAKAESARSAAVLALGLQILALLRNPGAHW
jgi:hypothetical protein